MAHRFCYPLLLLSLLLPQITNANEPAEVWGRSFGDMADQIAYSVAVDGLSNIVVVGVFQGSVDFGGGPLTSAGSSDIFVAKFDPAGIEIWSRSFGDSNAQAATSVAVDADGAVLLTGWFEGQADFGGGPLTSFGLRDIFLVKLAPDGTHLWSSGFGDARNQQAESVAADDANVVFLTGSFEGTVDFGGVPLTSAGSSDVFTASFTSTGEHRWSAGYGDSGLQLARSIATDANGEVVLTGEYGGSIDFGGGPLTSAGSFDIFLAKLTGDGAHLWSRGFGGASSQNGYSVAVDPSDNIVLTGSFMGSIDFGGGPLVSAGSADLFVAKFEPDGDHIWSRGHGDGTAQAAVSIVANEAGEVLITGLFWGSVDFGGGILTSAGSADVFLAAYTPLGDHIWSRGFGDAEFQEGQSVAVLGTQEIFLTGDFAGEIDFGGGALTSSGGRDIFLVKFETIPSVVADDPDARTFTVNAFPNPAASSTTITYQTSTAGPVLLRTYDLSGRLLRTIVSEMKPGGTHSATWDGRTSTGSRVAPGICFIRLETRDGRGVGKVSMLE